MPIRFRLNWLGWCAALTSVALLVQPAAAQQDGGPAPVDFGREVRPLLAKRCFSCHGPGTAEGGLRLHDPKHAVVELDSGQRAIVPGKPDESELLRRILAEDESERMPPEGEPLSAAEVATLRRWIAEGANYESHWAFKPVAPQQPPAVKRKDWVINPIDNFILARLEAAGLEPNPPADKLALLRRVTYDLTGLPPTPEEVDAFLADTSPNAYEKVVDRLLASEQYGERWARHWLDVVRYGESNSFERDNPKPNVWRYRDYVIRSLNNDKPYDRFIIEQLAGDELPDRSAETIIATGFYRLGVWDDEPADRLQARYDELDDIVSTTSQAFLGLTINCARCHDHKIDPIPQADYYKLLAFFQGVPSYGTRGDHTSYNQTDISPPEVAQQHAERDAAMRRLKEQMEKIEQAGIVKMSGEDQRITEGPGRKKLLEAKLKDYLDADQWREYEALRAQFAEWEAKKLPPRESALSVARCDPRPQPTRIMLRGNPHVPGDVVQPGYPALFSTPDPEIAPPAADAKTAGRRSVLASWIASPDNLLTARVMVNRLWQHHFGRGIVPSPNNFGLLGLPPTHPELLDWLAADFVRGGWRIKRMHRLMVLSQTYRMSSAGNEKALALDPQNNLFWRFNMRRLSAEEIRDAVHATNGRLNLKMYGPSIYPTIAKEVLAGQSRPGENWGRSTPEEQARRSVYIHIKRSLLEPLLASFDLPDPDSSCEARFVTTQPAQALALVNGQFIQEQAGAFAKRLQEECGEDRSAQVQRALRLALSRAATTEEIATGIRLMETWQQRHSLSAADALKYYCLYVYNLNEFVYLD